MKQKQKKIKKRKKCWIVMKQLILVVKVFNLNTTQKQEFKKIKFK